MASLKYQIATHQYDLGKKYRVSPKDKDGNPLPPKEIASQTAKQYKNHAIKFGEWCKANYSCRKFEECKAHIQDYANALKDAGKSASTIHTYLAAVCRVWEVDMETIDIPRRVVSENTRSRGTKAVDKRKDAQREISPRLYDFAVRVGIRRREHLRLTGESWVQDESGHWCVRVKGKGGKVQYQRILPEDVPFIRSYFEDKDEDECVFDRAELENKLDLHHLRALQAQRAYDYYCQRLQTEPAYREQLTAEIKARWEAANNKKRWFPKLVEGVYKLRGKNRKFAQDNHLQVVYDRLAVKAVSIFHLAHWRDDVTVTNYLLAV